MEVRFEISGGKKDLVVNTTARLEYEGFPIGHFALALGRFHMQGDKAVSLDPWVYSYGKSRCTRPS